MRIDSFDHPCESQSALNTEILTPPGRQIRIVILDRIGQGIADATARKVAIAAGERVATVAAERVGAMVLGRGLLYMASWQVQVAIVAIQVVIWYFGNDDLQNSLNDSVFGVGEKYKNNDDLKKQDEAFDKALVAIGFKDDATSGAEEAKSHG